MDAETIEHNKLNKRCNFTKEERVYNGSCRDRSHDFVRRVLSLNGLAFPPETIAGEISIRSSMFDCVKLCDMERNNRDRERRKWYVGTTKI